MRSLAIATLVGCTRAGTPGLEQQTSKPTDGRCGLIEAAVRSPEIAKLACGEAATQDGRLIVDVAIEPPLSSDCSSPRFALYRDARPTNTDALLQLAFSVQGPDTWAVGASVVDPPNSPDDTAAGNGFDDTTYYCHVVGVRVSRTENGWRAWRDPAW
ncbi:MAG: hypothetical protein HOV81_03705 [Kofleriaceae bacterium]|nr:hypothetical protein [Kofleriaceae bacterium]